MPLPLVFHGLAGGNTWKGGDTNGPYQDCGRRHVASTKEHDRGTESAWIFQLLSPLYQGLRIHRKTTTQTHTKRSRMAMGARGTKSLRRTKEMHYDGTCVSARQTGRSVQTRSGCLRIRGRSSTPTTKRGR